MQNGANGKQQRRRLKAPKFRVWTKSEQRVYRVCTGCEFITIQSVHKVFSYNVNIYKENKIKMQSQSKFCENNFTDTIDYPASEVLMFQSDLLTKSDMLVLMFVLSFLILLFFWLLYESKLWPPK